MLRRIDAEVEPEFASILRMRRIGDDPRWVLPGVTATDTPRSFEIDLSEAAPTHWRQRVPVEGGRFRFTRRVLVDLRLRTDRWQRLAPVFSKIERDGEGRFVDLDVDLSNVVRTSVRGEAARLQATIYAAPHRLALRHRSPGFVVPERPSWLDFAIGILEPAWSQGPIRFRLQACEGDDCRCLHEEIVDPADERQRGWQDRRLSLAALAGREVSLRFESEPVEPSPQGFTLAQWERPRLLVESSERPAGLHNLLLISLDTLRADHLGAYGYRRRTSPFMSGELASRSTLFESAVAPATTTAPSHMTLFTSLPPSVHGVVSNLRERRLPEGVPTLASILRRAGYATGSINEDGALSRRMGFDDGFDYYVEFKSAKVTRPEGHVGEIFAAGRRFVERHRHQRWFLFLHTYEVHYPYSAPAAYDSLFPEGDDPEHPDNLRLGNGRELFRPVLYDREIRHLDEELGGLLRQLEAAGDLAETLVVVTSDHGEAFREHSYIGHGSDVHQETVRVPLFILGPGIAQGRRVSTPVGLIDLVPTLLERLEVPAPESLMGRSFGPILAGEGDTRSWLDRPIVSEAWHRLAEGVDGKVAIDPPTLAVRRGRHKLIRYKEVGGPRYELYDLSADPGERRDLFDSERAVAAELRALADTYEQDSRTIVERLGLPPLSGEAPDEGEIDSDRLESLRALGYVE